MSYIISKTDGTVLTELLDRVADTESCSLSLFGYAYNNWATEIQQNSVWLLENFSSSTPPENPLTGQLWFDNALSELNLFTTEWDPLATRDWVMANFALGADYGGSGSTPQLTLTGDVYGSGSGSIQVSLAVTGVEAGVYTKVIVDDKGRVTAGGVLQSTDVIGGLGYQPVRSVNGSIPDSTGNLKLIVGGGGGTETVNGIPPDSTGNINLPVGIMTVNGLSADNSGNLALSFVSTVNGIAASPGGNVIIPTITKVNGVAPDSTGSITLPVIQTINGQTPTSSGDLELSFSGDVTATGTGNFDLTLVSTGVTTGTYSKVTVDEKGRVTTGALLNPTDVTTSLGYQPVGTINGLKPDLNGNIEIQLGTDGSFTLTAETIGRVLAGLTTTLDNTTGYLWNDNGNVAINSSAAPPPGSGNSVTLTVNSTTSDILNAIAYLISTVPTTLPTSSGELWNDQGMLVIS